MPKANKQRLDQELVRRGLADTLEAAKGLIMAGKVVVDDQRQDKPGLMIATESHIRIKDSSRFVSRAGDKLAGAIEGFKLASLFEEATVLDAGASTGGFSQCALEYGAKRVYAVDVGTNQLAWELRQDARIKSFEQTNIFDFSLPDGEIIDIVTADLSFTSLARIVSCLTKLASSKDAVFLVLVKPQFEIPRYQVPDGGIVQSDALRQKAVDLVKQAFIEEGVSNFIERDSEVAGNKGNREVFLFAKRS